MSKYKTIMLRPETWESLNQVIELNGMSKAEILDRLVKNELKRLKDTGVGK